MIITSCSNSERVRLIFFAFRSLFVDFPCQYLTPLTLWKKISVSASVGTTMMCAYPSNAIDMTLTSVRMVSQKSSTVSHVCMNHWLCFAGTLSTNYNIHLEREKLFVTSAGSWAEHWKITTHSFWFCWTRRGYSYFCSPEIMPSSYRSWY